MGGIKVGVNVGTNVGVNVGVKWMTSVLKRDILDNVCLKYESKTYKIWRIIL